MKKINVNLYQGNPEGLATKDTNNLFIVGDIEYNIGGGTIVKSITSVKNSDGGEIVSGGGGGDFPYKYAIFSGTITINPDDWEIIGGVPHLNMPICDANFESRAISMMAKDGSSIEFDNIECSQEGTFSAYCMCTIDDIEAYFYFNPSLVDNKIYMECDLDSNITTQINTVTFNNVIFINANV